MSIVEYSVFSHAMYQKSLEGIQAPGGLSLCLVLLALLFIIFVYTMLLIGLVGLFIAAWNIKK
ncbi:MAG: hypothetical protein V8S71_02275 [Oscillospiraceae bacterium]